MDEIYDINITGLDFNNAIGRIVPNIEQTFLINAAIQPTSIALEQWQQWKLYKNISYDTVPTGEKLPAIYDILDEGCQRLLPLIFRNLEYSGDLDIKVLKSYYKHIWVKNQKGLVVVTQIFEDLKTLDIDCLLLKGLSLLIGYYKDMGLRVTGDYDILIPLEDKQKVIKYFENTWKINLNTLEKLQSHEFHAISFKMINGIEIDVHWNLNYENGLHNNSVIFFENAIVKQANNGTSFKVLSATHQIFHTIIHGVSLSKSNAIRWITDCVIINKHEIIDWQAVAELCVQYNYKLPFAIACKVLPNFGINIPLEIVHEVTQWNFTKNELTFYNLIAGYKGKKDSWYNKIVVTYFYKKAMYNQFRKGNTNELFIIWYLKSFTLAAAIWLKKRL